MFRIVLCAHCRFKHIPQQRIAGGALNSDALVSESQSSWRSRQAFTRSVAEEGPVDFIVPAFQWPFQ